MIHLTENDATHISNYLKNRGKGEGIRVGVKTSGCSGLAYVLEFVDDIDEHDQVFEQFGVKVFVDPKSLVYLEGLEMDYVKNAKIMGAGDLRIMLVHILPNTKPILLSSVTIGFNNAVLAEAGMSYLQLGVQPPDASLGRMLSESQSFLFNAPWYALAPGIIIVMTVLGFSLVNDSV